MMFFRFANLLLLLLSLCLVVPSFAKNLIAGEGVYYCTPGVRTWDTLRDIGLGNLSYSGLGVTGLLSDTPVRQPSYDAFYQLDFISKPGYIEARKLTSGNRHGLVYRKRALEPINLPSSARIKLYKADPSSFNGWQEAAQGLGASLFGIQTLTRGKLYVLVGPRLGLIAHIRVAYAEPHISFCVRRGSSIKGGLLAAGYARLLSEFGPYRESLKGSNTELSAMIPSLPEYVDTQSLSVVEAIVSKLKDPGLVFYNDDGEYLQAGAVLAALTGLGMVAVQQLSWRKLLARRIPALSIVPPWMIDPGMFNGKKEIRLADDARYSTERVFNFLELSSDEQLEILQQNPDFEGYLRELLNSIQEQYWKDMA